VDYGDEFLHRLPVQQNIHLDQISSLVAGVLIVEAVGDRSIRRMLVS